MGNTCTAVVEKRVKSTILTIIRYIMSETTYFQGFHLKFDHGGMPPPFPTGEGLWWWLGDMAVNTINLKSTKL